MADGASSSFSPATPFVLASPRETLVARGVVCRLDGSRRTLAATVRAHLDTRASDDDAPVLVGGLPFDPERPAHLYEPRVAVLTRGASATPPAPIADTPHGPWRIEARPHRAEFARAVTAALTRMARPERVGLRKVVLARALDLEAGVPLDPMDILRRLRRDPNVSAFCLPLPDAAGRALVGATPELLLRREGLRVTSVPLAGSARRHADRRHDRDAADRLRSSDKERREHALVVEWIADRLAPYCATLSVPREPGLVSTSSMWHLATHLQGELRDPQASSVEIAAALHPTPAVCGVPAELAHDTIRELEPFDRGFFAGAVGWCAANGDGQWMVAIRCAEIARRGARLFAGVGIVPGSDPETELDETSGKFSALLQALSVDELDARVQEVAR